MECQNFQGSVDKHGYGRLWHEGKMVRAHRKAYAESRGVSLAAISGKVVRHKCDNPSCIEPSHLLLGSQQQNMDDKIARGRQAKGSQHGIAKLCEKMVSEIKREYMPGVRGCGTHSLAKRYGVNQTTILRIISGDIWGHVID